MSSTESLTQKWLRHNAQPYPNSDRIYLDVDRALAGNSALRPKSDVYTYDDGRTQLLLCIHGLLPIVFRNASYNIPIAIWLTKEYPNEPPIVYVVPTQQMLVKAGKYVDVSGRCQIEYVLQWSRKSESCNLSDLLEAMREHFSKEPPVYAKPASQPSVASSSSHQAFNYASRPPLPLPPSPLPTLSSNVITPHPSISDRPILPPKPPSSAAEIIHASPSSPPRQPAALSHSQFRHDSHSPVPGHLQNSSPSASPPIPPGTNAQPPVSLAGSSQLVEAGRPPRLATLQPASWSYAVQPSARQYATSSHPPAAPPPPPPPPSPPSSSTSTSPHPKPPAPFVNFLDEDPPNIRPTSQPLAPPPPRPPNPETLRLHSQVRSKISSEFNSLSEAMALDAERLRAHQGDLLSGEPAIRDEMARLEAVRDVCRNVAERMRVLVNKAEANIAELRRKGDPELDEFVCSTTIVHNQLIGLVAEDNAIEDTIYHLHRALNAGRIDLERFLRTSRLLAEEQFMKRALIEKIRDGLSTRSGTL